MSDRNRFQHINGHWRWPGPGAACVATIGLPFALATAALLSACSTPRAVPRDDERTRQFIASAYQPTDVSRGVVRHLLLTLDEHQIDIELLRPESAHHAPLVIYLPGLGESSQAGEPWRSAWAEAGYAVISLQPLAVDATAWSSDLARAGDFLALERERYGERAMSERLRTLAIALREARRRAESGDPDWQGVDFERAAIAGFDLGAFEAMIEAGEQTPELQPVELPITLRAVFAISPFASFATSGFSTRYGAIHAPVLSITSDTDHDPAGLVSSPSLRIVPFQSMPTGDKYLLVLNGVPHATLGSGRPASGKTARAAPGVEGSDSPNEESSTRSAMRRRSRGGGSTTRGDRTELDASPADVMALDAPAIRRGVVAVAALSTAFLDAYVKNDDLARSWLTARAHDWVKVCGDLRSK